MVAGTVNGVDSNHIDVTACNYLIIRPDVVMLHSSVVHTDKLLFKLSELELKTFDTSPADCLRFA